MADEQDPFRGESGLKDDFDGVITEAWFVKDPGQNGGNAYLNLKVLADDGDEVEQRYSCGPDWAVYSGGENVQHPKDKPEKIKVFNNASKIQGLVVQARDVMAEAGAVEVLLARSKKHASDNYPNGEGARYADLWPGLKFHWEIKSEDYKFTRNGEEVKGTTNTVLPTKYLGEVAVSPPSGGGSGGTSTGSGTGTSIPAPLLAQITAIAKAKGDYGQFVDAIMQIDGAVENQALMSKVADETWYKELANG